MQGDLENARTLLLFQSEPDSRLIIKYKERTNVDSLLSRNRGPSIESI